MGSERIRLRGDPGIEVTLRRSLRARRLSLRVSALDGRVTLTMPPRVPRDAALAFAEERQDWIQKARERAPEPVTVRPGIRLPLEGRWITLADGRRTGLSGDVLTLAGARPGRAAQAWLRALARDRLARASDRHAARIGAEYARLTLRDTRSRWGSCTADGRLMYSWRLIMAPPGVLDYVAAHEVAHLVHMDHSRRFWDLVASLAPGWQAERDWLRTDGTALHRYRFGP